MYCWLRSACYDHSVREYITMGFVVILPNGNGAVAFSHHGIWANDIYYFGIAPFL